MLHPGLSRALVTAHIEDLHRAATLRQAIPVPQGGRVHLQLGGLKPHQRQAGVGIK
jgi:hypothetical protein